MGNKKLLFIFGFVFFLIIIGLAIFINRLKSAQDGQSSPDEVTNITPSINLRPYITATASISPVSKNIDGKFFVFSIENIESNYQVEYQILYNTRDVQEGIFGTVDTFSNYSKEWFFGTKSTGDYRFHQGVEFGQVITKFVSDKNEYEITSDFRLQKIGPQQTILSDKDKTYSLDIPAGAIAKNAYAISHKTGGLPQKYSGVFLIDQPIGFFSSGIVSLSKNAKLKIKVDKNSNNKVIILGYDPQKKEWIEFETQFDPQTQTASAQVNLFSAYIVIEKSTSPQ